MTYLQSTQATPVVQTYTPVLQGATDNPVVTYGTQIGRYFTVGKLCYVSIVVTSTTMTKTTLTDALRVTLPLAAKNVASNVNTVHGRVENATPVKVASVAETVPNVSYLQFREVSLSAASALMTYGLADLGVLLAQTITVVASGWYEVN